jgi:hypothetical protein
MLRTERNSLKMKWKHENNEKTLKKRVAILKTM